MAESLDLEKMSIDAEAMNLMAQGKRHLLVHDYNQAVLCLEEACKLYDEKYGTSADECADAYLKYGHALLELHRQETGALDGLVEPKDGSDNEDEEEDEEIADDGESKEAAESKDEANGTAREEDISVSPTPADSEAATNGNAVSPAPEISNGNAASAGPSSSAEQQLAGPSSSSANDMETDVDPNQPSTSTGITDENRAEDEDESAPSNIEVAFEVLSMASDIYKRQTEYRDDAYLKLSDALQKLGEILMEWENNVGALEKLTECLNIRMRHLPDDDRLIAEVYYHIGLTHSLNNNVREANENFQKAIDTINMRLTKLKGSYTAELDESRKAKIEQEVHELEQVLPDMKGRIEELPAATTPFGQPNQPDERASLKELMEKELSSDVVDEEKRKQIAAKPIMNVTHLVKRKREDTEESESSKKLKNGAENGNENGHANGHAAAENVEMKE